MRLVLLCVMALWLATTSQGGTDWGDFGAEMGGLSPEEAAAVRARIDADTAAARARAEEARRAAEEESTRVAAERAARPLGERLVEARCLTCHAAAQIDRSLGTPGWTVTVLRMEWVNGARLDAGERAEIVRYLAARHPGRSRAEWAGLVAAGCLTVGIAAGGTVWRRRRRWPADPAP